MGRHTRKATPAIVRDVCELDKPLRIPHNGHAPDGIISQPMDTVTHSMGFGDSGYRVQVVEHDCPECGFDRMIRRIDVSPERRNEVRYWCLSPNCVHYVSDTLSYACKGSAPHRDTDTPAVYERA